MTQRDRADVQAEVRFGQVDESDRPAGRKEGRKDGKEEDKEEDKEEGGYEVGICYFIKSLIFNIT